MELTIEQALQQGVAAHKEGNLQDAERLYRVILQSQPQHPDANHNLGILAVSESKSVAALPLFKTALEANPNIEQFWVSYIEALIKEKKFDSARQVLEQAKKQGVDRGILNSLKGQLSPKIEKLNFADIPPQELRNILIAHYQKGRFSDAEKLSKEITQDFPRHCFAWKVLGAVLEATGRKSEALDANQTAVELSPQDAAAHFNLGNTLKELGRLDEALASYTQSIALKPDFVEAHFNLGNMLKELGRLDEAEASYRQAIALKPDYTEAFGNLGNTLKELGRLDEAEASYLQAILLKPDFAEAHNNLGVTLQELGRFDEAEASYRQAITLKPNKFIDVYDYLGVILQKKEKFDEAEVCFKKWSSLKPKGIAKTVSRGTIFFKQGLFEQALEAFESYDDPMSKAQVLESLCALGRVDDIYSRLEAADGLEDENIRIAAIAAFLAYQEKKDTAHNFCNKPMAFLHFGNVYSNMQDYECFNTSVIDELQHAKTEWEGQTTKNGAHGTVDIFENPLPKMSILHEMILDEIDIYYSKFKNETCSYIQKWPSEKNINGWHVVLSTQGYHTSHIHPTGWLSGVVYLKVVPDLGKNEGAIEFSLNGPNYHHKNSPNLKFQPKAGDIVLFPSSLHHKTIPFSTDTERIMISFDLQPATAKVTSEKN